MFQRYMAWLMYLVDLLFQVAILSTSVFLFNFGCQNFCYHRLGGPKKNAYLNLDAMEMCDSLKVWNGLLLDIGRCILILL